jgi:hypothetical protein
VVVLARADTISAKDVEASEVKIMNAMKIKNFPASACNPTIQYTMHENMIGPGS